MNNVVQLTASGDYVALPGEQHYRIYFDQMQLVCEVLRNWAGSEMGKSSPEGKCIGLFGNRLLRSIELLRLKYLAEMGEKMKLDLNESGFPHLNEIVSLENDAKHAEKELKPLPPRTILVEEALDQIFRDFDLPRVPLDLLGRRRYLETLGKDEFLGAFSLGELRELSSDRKLRRYVCSWACYNAEDNLVYLHWLEFEQNASEAPLNPGEFTYDRFLSTIRRLGDRAAPLVVLATSLDVELRSIHPKALRRMCIGPVLSTRFSFDVGGLAAFVRKYGDPDDVVFSMETEVIVSSRQIVWEKGWLFVPETLQEVFAVDESDPDCAERKLSEMKRYLFMPHRLWQTTLAEEKPSWLKGHEKAERYAFEKNGSVYEI